MSVVRLMSKITKISLKFHNRCEHMFWKPRGCHFNTINIPYKFLLMECSFSYENSPSNNQGGGYSWKFLFRLLNIHLDLRIVSCVGVNAKKNYDKELHRCTYIGLSSFFYLIVALQSYLCWIQKLPIPNFLFTKGQFK